jgi:hypothetical protein
MKLEDDLRDALARIEAPEGFAARVVARARLQDLGQDEGPTRQPWRAATRSWFVVLATAASLTVATSSGLFFLEHQKRADAERARRLALQALRLASAELQQIQSRVVNRRPAPAIGGQPSQNPSEQRP